MSTQTYPHLLTPLTVGSITLPNRVIMGSMHLGLEELPGGAERLAAFYRERAAGGAALIVTGGVSPNQAGRLTAHAATLSSETDLPMHRTITESVHSAGGRIALQILHAGRYGAHPEIVAPSPLQAPISPYLPHELSHAEILQTIADFAHTAALARKAGYDGVEIMGSEGYLLNEFTAPRTNQRTDEWGGSPAARHRFPVAVVRAVREALGPDSLLIYRLSMLDLVPDGSTAADVLELAHEVAGAGASLLNTGIGWHEARVPTIASSVPRGAFAWVTRRLAGAVPIPLIATNRINTPETAEQILADGAADLVSLARPFLADPEFVQKAAAATPERINTCIGCNQACLDHTFAGLPASCLVNPRAGNETKLLIIPAVRRQRIAVVGSGPAGLAYATTAAERGHDVTLFEASPQLGGQLNVAMQVPGKSEFAETLRYFSVRLRETGVQVRLSHRATVTELAASGYDRVVLATGVRPRIPDIPGISHPSVVTYLDVLRDRAPVGDRVVILGAGGIGFDVAEFLTVDRKEDPADISAFLAHWGIDPDPEQPGGITTPEPEHPRREVTLLQRSAGKLGSRLGKTTGWIHRTELSRRGVHLLGGVTYLGIDDAGLHIQVADESAPRALAADTIVLCTGQEPERELADALTEMGVACDLIGGADVAAELDAQRAIGQGTRFAAAT